MGRPEHWEADAGDASVAAAHAAMLHCGARGYVAAHRCQRRLRKAYFVAIVTPAPTVTCPTAARWCSNTRPSPTSPRARAPSCGRRAAATASPSSSGSSSDSASTRARRGSGSARAPGHCWAGWFRFPGPWRSRSPPGARARAPLRPDRRGDRPAPTRRPRFVKHLSPERSPKSHRRPDLPPPLTTGAQAGVTESFSTGTATMRGLERA